MHYLSPEFGLSFVVFLWVYWVLGKVASNRAQNLLLLLVSYLFYTSFSWIFALQLLGFSLIILALSRCVPVADYDDEFRRWPVVVGILLALANLGLFKYYNFFREDIYILIAPWFQGASLPVLNLVLPVGISFYTFQGIAYLVSIGRGERKPAGFINGLLHLSFFPTLLAGPICRPSELLTQIEAEPRRSVTAPEWAILLIISAIIKKVWLAAWLAETWVNPIFANPEAFHAIELLCGLVAYAWQLFFDFSGYTDIVTALALLLGFQLPVNFRQPYLAKSLSEFWQRWHITLSRWIRDYVYIPLGGNRCSWLRTQINLFIAMVLSGLWHGANTTFVIWGCWHGIGLILQNTWKKLGGVPLPGVIAQSMTFIFVCIGWLMFRAEDWSSVNAFLQGMQHWDQMPGKNWIGATLLFTTFFALAHYAEDIMNSSVRVLAKLPGWTQGLLLAGFLILIMQLAPAGMPGFIYFGF